jgi:hypothetical protein
MKNKELTIKDCIETAIADPRYPIYGVPALGGCSIKATDFGAVSISHGHASKTLGNASSIAIEELADRAELFIAGAKIKAANPVVRIRDAAADVKHSRKNLREQVLSLFSSIAQVVGENVGEVEVYTGPLGMVGVCPDQVYIYDRYDRRLPVEHWGADDVLSVARNIESILSALQTELERQAEEHAEAENLLRQAVEKFTAGA